MSNLSVSCEFGGDDLIQDLLQVLFDAGGALGVLVDPAANRVGNIVAVASQDLNAARPRLRRALLETAAMLANAS